MKLLPLYTCILVTGLPFWRSCCLGIYLIQHKLIVAGEGFVFWVSPVNSNVLLPFEPGLMAGETLAKEMMLKQGIPCAEVIAADLTKKHLTRDYMITRYIPPSPLSVWIWAKTKNSGCIPTLELASPPALRSARINNCSVSISSR